MTATLQILVVLMAVLAIASVAAARLDLPPTILLVIVGVFLALIPGLPPVELEPELMLLLILPPIIYTSAVAMSWREFRFNLRPILLLAVGCVAFTTVAVAAASHWLLGLAWPVGFVLGAIVSPPDAVAPLSIARQMQLPRRILVVLEGEGLANDATALVLFRFAVVAVSVGVFSAQRAAETFAAIVVGEVIWGVAVGWAMLRIRHWARDPRVEITLSILTPFLAYWPPEHLGGSGVIATVATGLYISWNGQRWISSATRLQGVFFWSFVNFIVEGMVFLVTGLQARTLIAGIAAYSLTELVLSAALVSAVVIIARFVWTFPATYLPRWIVPGLARRDPSPPWQWAFILAFTGIRGIVSLAAALAIPIAMEDGRPFPQRDLIIFLTFMVIMVTLVVQGSMLPWVIRKLGLDRAGHRERRADQAEELAARKRAIEAATRKLDQYGIDRGLFDDVLLPFRNHHQERLKRLRNLSDGDDDHRKLTERDYDISLMLIETERDAINDLYRKGKVKDEARRRVERELDLREADIANQRSDE